MTVKYSIIQNITHIITLTFLLTLAPVVQVAGQAVVEPGTWTHYSGNKSGHKYSPLDQITKDNVDQLQIAWRSPSPDLKFSDDPILRRSRNEDTPLMVNGRLYTITGLGIISALDPGTGETLWMHDPESYKVGRPNNGGFLQRGMGHWSDGDSERLLIGTADAYLLSLDAKTGEPDLAFGTNGKVDLTVGIRDVVRGTNFSARRPLVAGDVVIVGNSIGDVTRTRQMPPGDVQAYDVRSGKKLWTFHTIPKEYEAGYDTWLNGSAEYTGNANVWAGIAWDSELDYLYMASSTPTNNLYGGERPGDNLYAESVICVAAKTGERIWHFQAVHHGIWDYDFASMPVLAEITVDNRPVKAVIQVSKQAFTYVLDRETGEPIWPTDERPVPPSTVTGEQASPTQPFPTKPPAYDRQGVSENDLIDFTPELREKAIKVASWHKMGPIFTPPVVSDIDGPLGTLMAPATGGGTNWPGGAYDPETNTVYVVSNSSVTSLAVVPPYPGQSDMAYIQGSATSGPRTSGGAGSSAGGGRTEFGASQRSRPISSRGTPPRNLLVERLPLLKPPYGRLTAIDLRQGEIAWQVPHGQTPDRVANHPALAGLDIPRTGQGASVGTLVTKTLVIAGEAELTTDDNGKRRAMLRAYDKANGSEVGAVTLPAPQTGSPMTYMIDGEQYLVVAVSGTGVSGRLVAFKL